MNTDDMSITVVNTGTGFAVTNPNLPLEWPALSTQTVTWEVAGTTGNGIDTPSVNILLSLDGGFTYPIVLAANTADTSSAAMTETA